MAFEIYDNDELSYILVVMSGRHDDAELPIYQEAIYASPGYREKDELVDYSLVTEYAITSFGLRQFTERALEREEVRSARPDRKVALISPTDLEFGMSRVFTAHTEKMPANYMVFRDREEAIIWLSQPDE